MTFIVALLLDRCWHHKNGISPPLRLCQALEPPVGLVVLGPACSIEAGQGLAAIALDRRRPERAVGSDIRGSVVTDRRPPALPVRPIVSGEPGLGPQPDVTVPRRPERAR